jgi:hypothetical protein
MITSIATADRAPYATADETSLATVRAVALVGGAIGVLDALDGVAYFAITAGMNPIQVLQFIASGALGPAAYQGGLATAGLGALLHFGVSFVVAGVYVAAYQRSGFVRAKGAALGIAFGVAVWGVMNLLVVPMSAIGALPTVGAAIHGVVGHALTVGLTAALVTRKLLGRAS